MNFHELTKKAGRATPPPSLKRAVMEKIKGCASGRERSIAVWEKITCVCLGMACHGRRSGNRHQDGLPATAGITATEREEIAFYIEEITFPSTVGLNGRRSERYETTRWRYRDLYRRYRRRDILAKRRREQCVN